MTRPPRLSLPSFPHHVIQRGNNRMPSCRRLKEETRGRPKQADRSAEIAF